MSFDQLKQKEADIIELVNNFIASGNKELWGRIYEVYKKSIFVQCFKITNNEEEAKDITSDVFIRAAEKINTYESNRPILPWLYGIAKNLCIDHIRRKQRIKFVQIENAEDIKSDEDPVEDEDLNSKKKRIKNAVDKLKRPQRICFTLFYMHDKSYNDIAKLTGYSYDEVRSHIQNGRRKFKLIYGR